MHSATKLTNNLYNSNYLLKQYMEHTKKQIYQLLQLGMTPLYEKIGRRNHSEQLSLQNMCKYTYLQYQQLKHQFEQIGEIAIQLLKQMQDKQYFSMQSQINVQKLKEENEFLLETVKDLQVKTKAKQIENNCYKKQIEKFHLELQALSVVKEQLQQQIDAYGKAEIRLVGTLQQMKQAEKDYLRTINELEQQIQIYKNRLQNFHDNQSMLEMHIENLQEMQKYQVRQINDLKKAIKKTSRPGPKNITTDTTIDHNDDSMQSSNNQKKRSKSIQSFCLSTQLNKQIEINRMNESFQLDLSAKEQQRNSVKQEQKQQLNLQKLSSNSSQQNIPIVSLHNQLNSFQLTEEQHNKNYQMEINKLTHKKQMQEDILYSSQSDDESQSMFKPSKRKNIQKMSHQTQNWPWYTNICNIFNPLGCFRGDTNNFS